MPYKGAALLALLFQCLYWCDAGAEDTELVNDCGESRWALELAAHCCAMPGSAQKLWPV